MNIISKTVVFLCLASAAHSLYGQEAAGIGAALGREGGHFVVMEILPDSAAALSKAIQVGDRITAVGQGSDPAVPVEGLQMVEVVRLIRGPKGTTVRLTIIPRGGDESQARDVSLGRGVLKALARWGDGALLAAGTNAPDIAMVPLTKQDAEHLTDFTGKIVVMEFWSIGCGPCQKSMASLQGYYDQYPDWKDNVILIGASVDEDKEAATKHLESKGWHRTHNVSVEPEAIKAFHVNSLPTVYVIDRRGTIAASGNPVDIPKIVNNILKSR